MTLYNHSLHFSEPIYGRDPMSFHKLAANGGFEYYETRAHGCTMPEDVIQLDPALKDDYPRALAHYRRVGLDPAETVIWDLSIKAANDWPHHDLSVYMFTDEINAVRPDPERLTATKKYLNKNHFIQLCQGLVPTPQTVFGDSAQAIPDYQQLRLPLFVKGAISSTGSSVYLCNTPAEVEQAVGLMTGEYQLQEDIKATAFLSVEYDISDQAEVKHLMNTEQIINGVEYAGTRYPTKHHPQHATEPAANQAAKDGIRGKLGFDVAVDRQGGYFVLECNPRWTGAIYPMVIARRLGAASWSTAHLPVRANLLKEVKFGDLEYDPGRKTGVVLVNWGGIKFHWLEVLLIGNNDEQSALRAQLSKAL